MLSTVPSAPPYFLLLGGVVFVALTFFLNRRNKSPLPLPPGPPPLPLIGNVLDFPKQHLGREVRSISEKYGDVAYMNVFGQSVIVVNSYETAHELFEKRSKNYSDRPHSAMINLTKLDWMFVFKEYGPEWRKYRRELHTSFVPGVTPRYHQVQRQITRELLRNLLDTPADFSAHIEFSFAAVVLRITYGLDAAQGERKYYKLVDRLATIAGEVATPGRHIVEALPSSVLRLPSWFPGTGFKKLASGWKEEVVTIRDYLYDAAKETMKANGERESIITKLAEENVEEALARNVAATIYAAGADTTNASVHAFMFAMAMHPEAQCKAQAELDAVIGPERLPDFSDQSALPYVSALVKEVMRWHVVGPLSIPRRSVDDDEFRGYFIPKGSVIIPNQWAMSRDPVQYPDPERFYPERFLIDGKLNPHVRDPASFVICPGRHFGETGLFITCAYILHTLVVSAPLDEHGVPKKLELKINNLAVSRLEPFECRITARNAQMEALVRNDS
ncbi:cytochrome P450 [Trametes gibbosa]|nr:cytochrome P450 [Trametes gibbosa]